MDFGPKQKGYLFCENETVCGTDRHKRYYRLACRKPLGTVLLLIPRRKQGIQGNEERYGSDHWGNGSDDGQRNGETAKNASGFVWFCVR